MLTRMRPLNCDLEVKFIQDRISLVERHSAELTQALSVYARKAARLRDAGDGLASVTMKYADAEQVTTSLSSALAAMAVGLNALGGYGDSRVRSVEMRAVSASRRYAEELCRDARNDAKQLLAARQKEANRKRQLDRVRERNPSNRQQIVQAETELVQANAEVSRSILNLEEQVTSFERRKLHDMKTILLDLLSTEIGYHAKSLEILSATFKSVNSMDETKDLEEFKRTLRLQPSPSENVEGKKFFATSQSAISLTSILSGNGGGGIVAKQRRSSNKQKSVGIPTTQTRHWKSDEILNKSKHGIGAQRKVHDTEDDSDEICPNEEEDDDDDDDLSDNSEANNSKRSPYVGKKYMK